jgi:antitoxin HicB
MTLEYNLLLQRDDNGTLLVTCPQLPIVATFGENEADALRHGLDAVETALASMIDDGEDVPRPNRRKGGHRIRLPIMTSLKVQLYWALREAGITRAELGRRLGWNRESVDRLFRLDHRSRLEQLEAAFAALGKAANVDIVDRESAAAA